MLDKTITKTLATAVFASFPGGFARCLSVPFRGVAWRGLVTAKDADADGGRRTDPTPEPKICYNRL